MVSILWFTQIDNFWLNINTQTYAIIKFQIINTATITSILECIGVSYVCLNNNWRNKN